MSLYLYEATYTSESIAAQIKDPKDRLDVVKPVFDAVGGKVLAYGYPLGEYDVLVVYEAPDDMAAAALSEAVAGGAVKSARTIRLLNGQEYVASLRKAQAVAPQYRPAR